jgi:hypothetical protein
MLPARLGHGVGARSAIAIQTGGGRPGRTSFPRIAGELSSLAEMHVSPAKRVFLRGSVDSFGRRNRWWEWTLAKCLK